MISRRTRLALWALGLLLYLLLFMQGRKPTETAGIAPFFHEPDGRITVRLAGDFPAPGVYRFPGGISAETVTKMTLPSPHPSLRIRGGSGGPLATGDVLTLSRRSPQTADLSITVMRSREKMLLHIPLDPDRMDEEEWLAVPGIGPVLAKRIVSDRQSNGAFGGIDGVGRVRGIGPAKLAQLKRYF